MESKNASLLFASSIGELSLIRRLTEDGVDINATDKDGNSAIHEAAKANQVEALKLLLEKGADINVINGDGNSALHVAILATSLECFEFLLISGIEVNRFNKEKKSKLMCAMQPEMDEALKEKREKREKMIELLIENGNIDLKAETGVSDSKFLRSNYLFDAIRCGNVFAVEKLIEKDKTLLETKNENYPIHLAAEKNQLTTVKLLISINRKYLDIRGYDGITPLEYAVLNASFAVIEYLIEQHADVNLQSVYGYSALHRSTLLYANCCMRTETVCIHTASLQTAPDFQEKVVTFRKKCAYLAIAAYLLENGNANIYLQNEGGLTALDLINTERDIVDALKMLYLHKPLNDKINSLTKDLHALKLENIKLREEVNQKLKHF